VTLPARTGKVDMGVEEQKTESKAEEKEEDHEEDPGNR